MHRLAKHVSLPTKAQWNRMNRAAELSDLVGDPCSRSFKMKDLLRVILGDTVNKNFREKTTAEHAHEQLWYDLIKWWKIFKLVGFNPTFAAAASVAKKIRTA